MKGSISAMKKKYYTYIQIKMQQQEHFAFLEKHYFNFAQNHGWPLELKEIELEQANIQHKYFVIK